jgi:hypothetical protein
MIIDSLIVHDFFNSTGIINVQLTFLRKQSFPDYRPE